MRLKGKVAIVTGAGSGNGAAIALGYLKEGAYVTFADINEDFLKETVENLDYPKENYMVQRVDVTDRASVQLCVSETVKKYGRLDIMVANAGITIRKDFLEQTDADFEKVMNVNLKGTFITSQEAAKEMSQSGGGAIILMSSIASIIAPTKNIAPYGASKGAILSLARHIALDLGNRNIRVNAIAPGTIFTRINEARLEGSEEKEKEGSKNMMGRIGRPDELVGAAIFLASDESSFMTGTQIVIDGGEIAR